MYRRSPRADRPAEADGYSWKTAVKAFTDKGLNEYDAITNARLARILTIDDYDTEKQEVRLWTPKPDYEVNL